MATNKPEYPLLRRNLTIEAGDKLGMTTSCISCSFFIEHLEQCKRFGNQRPPARVIAFGCPDHIDVEEIPY